MPKKIGTEKALLIQAIDQIETIINSQHDNPWIYKAKEQAIQYLKDELLQICKKELPKKPAKQTSSNALSQ